MTGKWTTAVAAVLAGFMIPSGMALAQDAVLNGELNRMRGVRDGATVLDASDFADRHVFRQALEHTTDLPLKEITLWEVADVHLAAANRFDAGVNNGYARRAISAWTAYIDFASESNRIQRLHQAVEYLQRSYVHALAYQEMFAAIARIQPRFVNHNVVARWEDRLRTCPSFSQSIAPPWHEPSCVQNECKAPVAGFYSFMQGWLGSFPLTQDLKAMFAARANRVPAACRAI